MEIVRDRTNKMRIKMKTQIPKINKNNNNNKKNNNNNNNNYNNNNKKVKNHSRKINKKFLSRKNKIFYKKNFKNNLKVKYFPKTKEVNYMEEEGLLIRKKKNLNFNYNNHGSLIQINELLPIKKNKK